MFFYVADFFSDNWTAFFLCDNIQWEINHEKSQQFGDKMWYNRGQFHDTNQT